MNNDGTRELSRQMMVFHRLYNERIARRFQAMKMRNLSHAETFLMCILLDQPGLALGELVNRTMMSKQQVNHLLNQLEEKGLLVRRRLPENRRIVHLEPTEAALQLQSEALSDAESTLEAIFLESRGEMSVSALSEYLGAIRTINRILERFPAGREEAAQGE